MFARLMGLKTVSPAALSRLMQAGEPIAVIDVNSRQSWLKARVPGARNASWVEFTQDELPSDKTAFLVFYCSNMLCRKAPNAARRAAQMALQRGPAGTPRTLPCPGRRRSLMRSPASNGNEAGWRLDLDQGARTGAK